MLHIDSGGLFLLTFVWSIVTVEFRYLWAVCLARIKKPGDCRAQVQRMP